MEEAKRKLTTTALLRKDAEMIMKPYTNWDQYLTPAPMSIAVLGELVFLSTKDDFSINRNPPEGGFKYMKYPHSFRASLMQVCNSGWVAFNQAHSSMDSIRLQTATIPGHLKKIVQIILMDDNLLVKLLLPASLSTLDNIAKDCLEHSKSTTDSFQCVVALVNEILKACTHAEEAYNQDLQKVNATIEEYELQRKAKEEEDKRAEVEFKLMKDKWAEAEKFFDETMKKMPSGWDLIGMNLAEGLSESLNSLVAGLVTAGLLAVDQKAGGLAADTILEDARLAQMERESSHKVQLINSFYAAKDVYSDASVIVKLIEELKILMKDDKIVWSDFYDQRAKKAKSDPIKDLLVEFRRRFAKAQESDAKITALRLCDTGIAICKKLGEIAPKGECGPAQEQELSLQIADLLQQAQMFNSKGRQFTMTSPLSKTPPALAKALSEGKKRAGDNAMESTRIQLAEAIKAVGAARELYSKASDKLEKRKEELVNILVILVTCDIEKINFETTLKFLTVGLKALAEVQQQWEKMVHFFQVVTNIITTSIDTATNTFMPQQVPTDEPGGVDSVASYSSAAFTKDMLYSQTFHVSSMVHLVNVIATTYTEVSDKHIMARISSLARLMTLKANQAEFAKERKALQDGCKEAQDFISVLVQKNKADFSLQTGERLTELKGLQALLPTPAKEEEEKISKIVDSNSEVEGAA